MGLIDKMKEKAVKMLAVDSPQISISMMGPRAVGKTTVMASIFAQSQESISGSQLYMRSANDSASALIGYRTMLSHAIENRDAASLPATNAEADFLFELGLLGKKPTVRLAVKDFPGEFLTDQDPAKRKMVAEFVSGSHVVMVAIDTPYLMEEDGRYNDEKNMPGVVKDYLLKHAAEMKNKLVLFVPLKCERYFHEKRMEEVSQKVVGIYGDIVNFFLDNNIASLIAPIITLGGMEFDKMEDNTTGMGSVSKIATYRIYEDAPVYEPLFCSQPLFYLLTYVSSYYAYQQAQPKGFIDRLKDTLNSYLTADTKFRNEIGMMHKRIVKDKFGYRVMTTNSIFNF